MSKELLVAGAIVVVCLGVTAIALTKPGSAKTKPSEPVDVAHTEPSSFATTPPSSMTPIDSFGRDNLSAPPGTADLNPNRPFDNFGMPGPGQVGSSPVGERNPFPGSSAAASQPSTLPATSTLPPVASAPTSAAEPSAPAPSAEQVHVVKRGDTLAEISKRYYGTTKHWKLIKEANKVDPDGLHEGEKLTIPALPASATATTASSAPTGDGTAYVVQKEDTYYKIAKRELGDPSRAKEIEKLNKIPAADLRPGMKLTLPARGARDTAATAPEAPAQVVPGAGKQHTVGKDEYLTDISKRYYGSTKHWRVIAKANPGIDPDRLKVGQKLTIPELAGADAASGAAAAGEGEYVVVAGDTFESIAGKVLGDRKQHKKIAEANPGVDASRLRVGQKLKVPAASRPTSSAPAPSPSQSTSPSRASAPAPLPEPSFSLPPVEPAPLPAPSLPAPSAPMTPVAPATPVADPWNLNGAGSSTGSSSNPWADLGGTSPTTP